MRSGPAVCADGRVVCAATLGVVVVLDGGTGVSEGEGEGVRLDGEIHSDVVVAEGGRDVYVGCRDGCLYKLQLDRK